jgi:hypothetical protein
MAIVRASYELKVWKVEKSRGSEVPYGAMRLVYSHKAIDLGGGYGNDERLRGYASSYELQNPQSIRCVIMMPSINKLTT